MEYGIYTIYIWSMAHLYIYIYHTWYFLGNTSTDPSLPNDGSTQGTSQPTTPSTGGKCKNPNNPKDGFRARIGFRILLRYWSK